MPRKCLNIPESIEDRIARFQKDNECQSFSEAWRRLVLASLREWEEQEELQRA